MRRDQRVVCEMGRSLVAHHNKSCMVLVTHSSSGVQLQVTVIVKVVSKVSPSLVLVEQLFKICHVCKVILGHITLADSRLRDLCVWHNFYWRT